MGKYFLETETVRVTFEDGQWVDVKQELTQEDSDYILTQMTKTTPGKSTQIDIRLGRLPLLERSIVVWSFVDDAGNPVPVNSENISRLRNKYRILVLQKVDELNRESQAFSKK